MKSPTILVADPRIDQLQDLVLLANLENLQVEVTTTEQQLMSFLSTQKVLVLMLDQSFAEDQGLPLLQQIRNNHEVPIIFTGAQLIDSVRITAFEMGADHVVQRPYHVKEMILRILAILRRSDFGNFHSTTDRNKSLIQLMWKEHLVHIDLFGHQVHIDDRNIELTSSEWEIFVLLLNHPGHVFTRDKLSEQCLGYSPDGETRTIDTHMANLRNKLGVDQLIETVRGYGYRMAPLDP